MRALPSAQSHFGSLIERLRVAGEVTDRASRRELTLDQSRISPIILASSASRTA